MEKTLKTGLITAAGSQLANLISNSSVGAAAYDSTRAGYGLEHFVDGATQASAFAGLTLAAYGATKAAIGKGMPFVSEKTTKAASLTSAASVAYALASTDVFKNALYNMTAYDHQVARGLEMVATAGIAAGLVVAGTLFAKDIYDLTSAKLGSLVKRLCLSLFGK